MNYQNPIIPGFHPDPSICRVGEDHYLVTSSFEFFPGVPIYHSKDLIHWREIGHCLTRPGQLPLEKAWISGGIFAPTLRHHDGRFYMITTNVTHGGNFYVYTDDIAGAWSEPIYVDMPGIDPDLFWDDDGTVYFTGSSREGGRCRIAQCRIDIETGERLSEIYDIWDGSGGKGAEAPHLYKINSIYYLMIAEGGTEYGHMETIARGDQPQGPWEECPRNPILTHRSIDSPIQATGHGDLVEDQNGNWWMVHLGIRPNGYHSCHNLGRETFLVPVTWDDDGWPIVGDDGRSSLDVTTDNALPCHPWPAVPERDDFDNDALRPCWNFIRMPIDDAWSLSERPGHLTLRCWETDLDAFDNLAWLGRRQQHHNCKASTRLDFEPAAERDEAGLAIYQNLRHHYEIGVTGKDTRKVFVRRRIGDLMAVVAEREISAEPITLTVTATPTEYSLGFSQDGKDETLITAAGRYLSTEVGGLFTGVYFAMYATGNGTTSEGKAHFDWFDYCQTHE